MMKVVTHNLFGVYGQYHHYIPTIDTSHNQNYVPNKQLSWNEYACLPTISLHIIKEHLNCSFYELKKNKIFCSIFIFIVLINKFTLLKNDTNYNWCSHFHFYLDLGNNFSVYIIRKYILNNLLYYINLPTFMRVFCIYVMLILYNEISILGWLP